MSEVKSSSLPAKYTVPSPDEAASDFWQRHLDCWRKSGLTQSAYCRRNNLRYTTFRKWKERLCNYYPSDSWDTKSNSNSIKLVEVKSDFLFDVESPPPSTSIPGFAAGPNSGSSGIRFWCGEFCIEVDVEFSSKSLSQLLLTLQGLGEAEVVKSGVNRGSG